MENFSTEIIDLIKELWSSDEELVKDALFYMYHTTMDIQMQEKIVDYFNNKGYCIDCGSKLTTYTWDEIHTELEYNNREPMFADYCKECDKYEITRDMKEVE